MLSETPVLLLGTMEDIQQIDLILGEIKALKAPGISGSRIKKLTEIAIKNISVCITRWFFIRNIFQLLPLSGLVDWEILTVIAANFFLLHSGLLYEWVAQEI